MEILLIQILIEIVSKIFNGVARPNFINNITFTTTSFLTQTFRSSFLLLEALH